MKKAKFPGHIPTIIGSAALGAVCGFAYGNKRSLVHIDELFKVQIAPSEEMDYLEEENRVLRKTTQLLEQLVNEQKEKLSFAESNECSNYGFSPLPEVHPELPTKLVVTYAQKGKEIVPNKRGIAVLEPDFFTIMFHYQGAHTKRFDNYTYYSTVISASEQPITNPQKLDYYAGIEFSSDTTITLNENPNREPFMFQNLKVGIPSVYSSKYSENTSCEEEQDFLECHLRIHKFDVFTPSQEAFMLGQTQEYSVHKFAGKKVHMLYASSNESQGNIQHTLVFKE